MIFALIKNGVVENTIVADASFILSIQNNWDFCICIDEMGEAMPSIGWSFDGVVFTAPTQQGE